MIDTSVALSAEWWAQRLHKKLVLDRPTFETLDSYLRSENSIPVPSTKSITQSYQRLMRMAGTNYAELTVEAVRERMEPTAFLTGAEGDGLGDREAWRIWQANSLDADWALTARASLGLGMGYMIVGPTDREIGAPLITPEDPRQVTVEVDPARRRRVRAALKVWYDDVAGVDRINLYLPGFIHKLARDHRQDESEDISDYSWDGPPMATGIDRVPVVSFPNRPDTYGRTAGEFEHHLSVLDRINFTVLERVEVATLQAYRQRAVKGVPSQDADGNEINYDDLFSNDPGAMWHLPATGEIWESEMGDLGPLRSAARDDVETYALVSRTPIYYLTPDAANGSAEGASLKRESLVFKTLDRITETSESLEQVMSLAFEFAGDTTRARRGDMEVLWKSPENFSLAEKYDAASKAQAAGVPWRSVMTDILQFSETQVARMEAERSAELLLQGLLDVETETV